MDPSRPEKRKAKRVAKPFVLRMQKTAESDDKEWAFIFVKDISKIGLAFRTNDEFREGDLLNLKVGVSKGVHPIECRGEVVRIDGLKNAEHFFEVAVIFVDLSLEDEQHLERMVRDHSSGPEAYSGE